MRCPRCHRPMLLLFTSAVCDSCESPPKGTFYRGFVVWRADVPEGCTTEYVFKTAHDAVVWRSLTGHEESPIRCVLSEHPIPWRVASGRAAGLVCADKLFDVYRDHRFPPAPYRAFLAPDSFYSPRECVQLSA